MSDKIHFVTTAEQRVELALCLKRIVEFIAHLVQTEEDPTARKEIAIDLIAANNISFGIIFYRTISTDDVNWIIERHAANELWTAEQFASRESQLRSLIEGNNHNG